MVDKRGSRFSSAERWSRLSMLLGSIERLIEANSRLDAHRERALQGRQAVGLEQSKAAVCQRLDLATARVGREIDKITSQRLQDELTRKTREQAA